jgi:predicted RNA-binding Zn-ribbon protein involved in translation (DUF1610 family)
VSIELICSSCGRTLQVPDSAAGLQAQCPECGQITPVPAPIQEAEEIGAEEIHGPTNINLELGAGSLGGTPDAGPAAGTSPGDGSAPRRPCPMCGEMIVVSAAKCRFCGTIFDPALKKEEEKKNKNSTDADLTGLDWVLCILCAGIGCILGIVYAVQGKPKGPKMIGISIAAAVVWNILNAILQASMSHPRGF